MWRRWLTVLLAAVLTGCASKAKAPVGDRSTLSNTPSHHSVKQGDTLYSIAFLYGFSVEEVAAWNNLSPPYTIYKRQHLRLTPPPVKARPAPPKPRLKPVAPSRPKPLAYSRPKTQAGHAPVVRSTPKTTSAQPPRTIPAETPPIASTSGRVLWSWPVDGTLIKRFTTTGSGKKGIDIAGKNGQSVRAAASGKVVYSGSGLSGYGRLIIIKHNNDFLSAYAHNRKLIAREGMWVNKGEVIAQMGSSGTDRVKLHFEIRKRGKPVDPLRYLPRK